MSVVKSEVCLDNVKRDIRHRTLCSESDCEKFSRTSGLCKEHWDKSPQRNAYNRAWYAKNRIRVLKQRNDWAKANPKIRKESCRESHLKSVFGLTLEQYDFLILRYGGVCVICGRPETTKHFRNQEQPRRLAIDHNHNCCPGKKSCGKCIRGLLCNACNTAIGKMGDDPIRLRKAADYLEQVV